MGRVWDDPPRHRRPDHSMGELRLLFPTDIDLRRRPAAPVEMFDQDDPDLNAADRCVLLTPVEARLIAGILSHARAHVPSPKSCDEAIDLLTLAAHRPV